MKFKKEPAVTNIRLNYAENISYDRFSVSTNAVLNCISSLSYDDFYRCDSGKEMLRNDCSEYFAVHDYDPVNQRAVITFRIELYGSYPDFKRKTYDQKFNFALSHGFPAEDAILLDNGISVIDIMSDEPLSWLPEFAGCYAQYICSLNNDMDYDFAGKLYSDGKAAGFIYTKYPYVYLDKIADGRYIFDTRSKELNFYSVAGKKSRKNRKAKKSSKIER